MNRLCPTKAPVLIFFWRLASSCSFSKKQQWQLNLRQYVLSHIFQYTSAVCRSSDVSLCLTVNTKRAPCSNNSWNSLSTKLSFLPIEIGFRPFSTMYFQFPIRKITSLAKWPKVRKKRLEMFQISFGQSGKQAECSFPLHFTRNGNKVVINAKQPCVFDRLVPCTCAIFLWRRASYCY